MSKSKSLAKLYWFHPHFYNWMGGHKYIYEVCKRLQTTYGVKVTIVTSGIGTVAKSHFGKAHIPVITSFGFTTRDIVYWLFLPFFIKIETWYFQQVKKLDKEALYISSMFPFNVVALKMNRRSTQLCYEPFAFFYDRTFVAGFSRPTRLFITLTKFFYQRLDKGAVAHSEQVLTLSQFNRNWIQNVYGVDSKVVYEGVDLDFFKPTTNLSLKKKYQKQDVIFHSTDYTPIKGTEFLLKAFALALQSVPSLTLIISETLPNSPAKKQILDLASSLGVRDKIQFAGFLPYEDLPAYLSLARVVVQPSQGQSMNLTIKEAMACQTAVITSLEGIEQTKDGEAGFLVDPHDSSTLAQRIVECVLDTNIRTRLGKKGRLIVEKKFSWDAVTKAIWHQLPRG